MKKQTKDLLEKILTGIVIISFVGFGAFVILLLLMNFI